MNVSTAANASITALLMPSVFRFDARVEGIQLQKYPHAKNKNANKYLIIYFFKENDL